MLHTAEMNTKKLPVGCGAAEAPRPALDSTANSGLVWGMDVVNWTLLLVRLRGGDRDESTCPVPLQACSTQLNLTWVARFVSLIILG
jgi:hypothetical protein